MPEQNYPKAERIENELRREIASGAHGAAGTPFMTTRYLMEYKAVSLKTAHLVLARLCGDGLLEVRGKRYYLKDASIGNKKITNTIGLLLTRLDTPYFSNLASNIEELARELGFALSIAVSDYDAALERSALESFVKRGVSGIIACPWAVSENAASYEKLPVPFVLIGRRLEKTQADAVLVDNRKAASDVAKHLVKSGCDAFCYVGPRNLSGDERLAGFRLGLLESSAILEDDSVFLFENHESDMSLIAKKLRRNAQKKIRTGVFCYHDLYASKVITLCHTEKLSLPRDAAVAGFDNLPVAAAIWPALTSVAYPVRGMARMACEILFTRMKCHRTGGGMARYLEPELIIRNSTDENL